MEVTRIDADISSLAVFPRDGKPGAGIPRLGRAGLGICKLNARERERERFLAVGQRAAEAKSKKLHPSTILQPSPHKKKNSYSNYHTNE